MRENFLHYIWKYKKFEITNLKTTNDQTITLVSIGEHNHNSGPDFFNAQLKIEDQLWAGNVEIHLQSSDWYVHHHENDTAYDNVILHVVWEHDSDIFRKDNSIIPTLELKKYVHKSTLEAYGKLFSKTQKWINCEENISDVNEFLVKNWLERLYVERLERQSNLIHKLQIQSENNWEEVLFKMLAKNFGLKVNGEAFLSIANSVNFSVVRKLQNKQTYLEALLFGQAQLLDTTNQESYVLKLKEDYHFLKSKFKVSNTHIIPVQFFRLRPLNFPTIRLSQLANIYEKHQNLCSKIIEVQTIKEIYELFKVSASEYWDTHYTFGTTSKYFKKTISKSLIDLIIINTIIPIKFSYAKQHGQEIDETIINLIQHLKPEKNGIVNMFNSLKLVSKTALESQALLELKNEYCVKNKCLQCVIGNSLLH